MNEWLGEPVLVFQLPGRGILRNFINNLALNQFYKSLNWDFEALQGKQKTPSDIPPGVFCFPWGKQKTPGAIHNPKLKT